MKIFMLDEDDPKVPVPVVPNNLDPGSGRSDMENLDSKAI